MIYKFIKRYRSTFRVMKMCQVLEVSRSSYYGWLRRPVSVHQKEDKILVEKMWRIHKESYKTYGIRRIKAKMKLLAAELRGIYLPLKQANLVIV